MVKDYYIVFVSRDGFLLVLLRRRLQLFVRSIEDLGSGCWENLCGSLVNKIKKVKMNEETCKFLLNIISWNQQKNGTICKWPVDAKIIFTTLDTLVDMSLARSPVLKVTDVSLESTVLMFVCQ